MFRTDGRQAAMLAFAVVAAAFVVCAGGAPPVSGQGREADRPQQKPGSPPVAELKAFRDALRALQAGQPVTFRGLTMFPLTGRSRTPFYATLDEALAAKDLEIRDTGRVEDVEVVNRGRRPVLIVDGEQIVGAKQNRVFNSSLMVPPGRTVVAKVSCVEQGRWSAASEGFRPAGTQLFARARQTNIAAVSDSLRTAGSARGDQHRVWAEVAEKNAAVGAASATGAMQAAYETRRSDLEEFVRRLRPVKGQVGAVFAVGGEVVGMDFFDSAETFGKLHARLVKSYALEALSSGGAGRAPSRSEVLAFIAAAGAAGGEVFPSPGEGSDLRLSGWKVAGASLIVRGLPVHSAVFAREGSRPASSGDAPPLAPPGRRGIR